jgi:Leucine-rich repeat (LRR) protein
VPDLEHISQLEALHQLTLIGHRSMSSLEPLSNLTALQQLHLAGCGNLITLEHISKLVSLRHLDLSDHRLLHSHANNTEKNV